MASLFCRYYNISHGTGFFKTPPLNLYYPKFEKLFPSFFSDTSNFYKDQTKP